jgi:superfamily II DNA or RNA helicase
VIEHREYQHRAIADARAIAVKGVRSLLLVAPTGAGKTTIGAMIAQGRIAKGGRVAWFAHRRELITQAADRLRAFGLDVGANGANVNASVQVTSVQTVLARRQMPTADLVVLDEAHHYVSHRWSEIARSYAAAKALTIGFTATPERADGTGLGEIFDALIVVAQLADLVRSGQLVACDVVAPRGGVKKLALDPVDAWEKYADRRSTVVFAPHVKAAEDFAAQFRARDVAAEVVHGETPIRDRDAILARFAAGDVPVLVNVGVLTEGWDCPRAKVVILARRIGSPSLYLQCVGRVLRPDGTGLSALLVDLSGNYDLHGHPEDERVFSLTGTAVSRKDGVVIVARFCKSCSAELGPDDIACPDCGRSAELVTPTAEGVELARVLRDEQRQQIPEDKRVKILATIYEKKLRAGHKRSAGDHAYRGMFRHFPPADVRARAWEAAVRRVAAERGDAWEPS